MKPQKLENETSSLILTKPTKKGGKKWWLIPPLSILIVAPITLTLTLAYPNKEVAVPKLIIDGNFAYNAVNSQEFQTTISNYKKIKQRYIAGVTKEISIYLPQEEWDLVNSSNSQSIAPSFLATKIINTLSNTLRLMGLIDSDKALEPGDFFLENFETTSLSTDRLKFSTNLKYGSQGEEGLEVGGFLHRSQTEDSLKVINNETMPKLIEELNTNNELRNKINWNYYGFSYYGMNTIGEKDSITGRWIGEQKIDLAEFNRVALTWFLDFLKKTNLIDYRIDIQSIDFSNFRVEGWKKENLYLKHKEGLWTDNSYTHLSEDNCPMDEDYKPRSIVATLEFGWYNPLTRSSSFVGVTGSYLLGPVGDYYVSA